MASDWKTTTFEESSIEILDGDRGKNYPKKSEFTESGYCLFLNTGNVTKDGFKFSSTEFVSSERDQLLRKGKLQREDVVLTTRGTVGNVAYYDSSIPFDHIRINSGMVILRSDDTKILPRYLYLFLRSKLFEDQVIALQSGSAQPQLPIRDIKRVEIKVPSVTEQKTIAHILGSLDDKIELNRQMNETLEAMAQALFKSWLVNFDPVIDNALAAGNAIPDEFFERAELRKGIEKKDNSDIQDLFPEEFEFTEEMGWIPKGWAVGKYSDLAELNPLSWSKKSIPEEISYVDLGNTNNGKIDLVVSYSASEAPSRAKRVLSTDDTIIGTVRPGNRSFAFIHNEGLTGSTGFAVMKPIQSINRTYTYLGLTQSVVIEYLAHIADGGAYPAINPSVVADLECIIPPSKVLEKFDDLAYCFLKKIGENNNHNETLAKVRDALLPKLMSGELRISDAAELVDEVL